MLQICENIRLARIASGKSKTEMGLLLGVPRTTYGNWERDTEPTLTILKSIAQILNIDMAKLIGIDIPKNATKDEEITALLAAVKILTLEVKRLRVEVFKESDTNVSLEYEKLIREEIKQLRAGFS